MKKTQSVLFSQRQNYDTMTFSFPIMLKIRSLDIWQLHAVMAAIETHSFYFIIILMISSDA